MADTITREDKIKKIEEDILDATHREAVTPTHDFEKPEDLYASLVKRIKEYHPSADTTMVEKAYKIAREAHKDQKRKSGEPYIIHPLCVAIILADLELDKETIIAGILHDVVEDTVMTNEEIRAEFGEDVEHLVDGVTKLGQLSYDADKVEVQGENLRKMFLAMAKDIRVIVIKLADRLHNMRTLQYMKPEKQKEKARETMEIYSPIAQRLGISKIKIELDDLSLKYLEPDAYYDLVEKIAMRKSAREEYIAELVGEVKQIMKDADIEAAIEGRVKHFFSIYKKMVNQNKTLDQIYDLFAIRIIVESVRDCYAALGAIHEAYNPIPGRFKDYIAMPKPNMYQSLHTTLIGKNGQPFEIQIRTFEMHKTAEFGIAAHWKYKEESNGNTPSMQEEEKLSWLRQILEWQQDMSDNREFLSILKSDLNLFSDSVFCFTPAGDVKSLPIGSTPIDFAYAIHTAVGNRMVGAKVNNRLVPIDYQLRNGDRVEIVTSQNAQGPSRDWLSIVKSAQAKSKINSWFKSQFKEENIQKGKELLIANAKQKGLDLGEINKAEYQKVVIRKYGYHNWDAVLASIGHGGLKEGQVINKLLDCYEKDHPKQLTDEEVLTNVEENKEKAQAKPVRKSKSGIIVKGMDDMAVRFSKCCNPVPGDEIVGFVTRGRGVSIHRTDCTNIIHLSDFEKDRLIEAEWQGGIVGNKDEKYLVEIKVFANNRTGLLADISRIFTERDIDIINMSSRISKQGVATLSLGFEIKNKDELAELTGKIRQIAGVMDIERTAG